MTKLTKYQGKVNNQYTSNKQPVNTDKNYNNYNNGKEALDLSLKTKEGTKRESSFGDNFLKKRSTDGENNLEPYESSYKDIDIDSVDFNIETFNDIEDD